MAWRLVDSGVVSPEDSMAMDEAVLEARICDGVPDTLHLYVRCRPVVSLGYFQKAEASVDLNFCKSKGIGVLRRVSGGSAVYTDQKQLIYAFATKQDLGTVRESYKRICDALVLGFSTLGMKTRFKPVNDILMGGKKVSGSSQIRRQGTLLQHGTILLDADFETMFKALKVPESKFKPQGLKHPVQKMTSFKAEGFDLKPDQVKKAITSGFEQTFDTKFEKQDMTVPEKNLTKRLMAEKYACDSWNLRR